MEPWSRGQGSSTWASSRWTSSTARVGTSGRHLAFFFLVGCTNYCESYSRPWPRCCVEDGSSYEGDWRNGRKQGQGTYISEENLKYTGPLPVSDVASSCHSCWVLVDGIQLSFALWKAKVRSDVRQPAASPVELRAKSSSL